MNVHDSEKIAGIFSEFGYEQAHEMKHADVIVLNTCSIRQKAEQKVFSELGRLKAVKKFHPHLKIAVAGCIAQQRGDTIFKKFPYVDFVFGPQNIVSLKQWINKNSRFMVYGSPCKASQQGRQASALEENPHIHMENLPLKRERQVRAWVSIMFGCDNFCAYCVVPFTRGREKSRPSTEIVQEIQNLAKQGYKEVTLLGQNVNSYGKNLDEKRDFSDLLKVIHEVQGIERIRFVTSHPRDFSEKLKAAIRELPKICEHIHLPVQSGSDRVLNLMNRGYTYSQYREKIDRVRKEIPGIAITTDIIVGFPGETGDDFRQTMHALQEIEYDGIFAFKYSERPDTRALTLPDHVDEKIKSQRLSKVLELQGEITYTKNKELEGKSLKVLVEGLSETDREKLTGRTRTNKIVNFYGDVNDIGTIVTIKILEAKRHSLYGEKV